MKKKRLLVIITEGPTDEEFYKAILEEIRIINSNKKFNFDKIVFFCASGISKMYKKMLAKFKYEICIPENSDYEKIVCFCYDLDVFKFPNPPINREKMIADFKTAGASKTISIIADPMIENFFLYDLDGIRKYLKLKKTYDKSSKKGFELLKQMFKDANKTYTKGTKVEGLVKSLNIRLILCKICYQIKLLCNELGCFCNGEKCK